MLQKISKLFSVILAGAMFVGMVACAPAGPRVLKLWYYEPPTSAMGKAWAAAQTQFLAAHPGVKIAYELHTFEQLQKTAQMVLNSSSAPDLIEMNKGAANAGTFATEACSQT